ncbi:Protein phosphatase 2C and cyclic nucleotide-binding/kinase domain-containing protein [Coccomyxa sp. Obi]|nr:Protein phosphatase 2C and cyclic nucleotide-binding/kinase domain-containing protein [Coccomyxa sp. Obi]
MLRYAFVSQRGYYPEALDKENQDAVCVYRRYGGDSEQLFFGVFDGHGQQGTSCAQFAKDTVPQLLLCSTVLSSDPVAAFSEAMFACNEQLRASAIDDSLSGTTAIACLIRGRAIYVANVGDSRAVLAERVDGELLARPLSHDHTPFREDECERVKKFGAVILTLDQLEGLKDPTKQAWTTEEEDDGDPPRIWAPNAMYPGTAFTRSIGDSLAEQLGVTAEPEVVTAKLSADRTPLLVIASDGVFEFMSNQAVIQLASKYNDPQQSAIALVAEAYRLWLEVEVRTDDITAIVIRIDEVCTNGVMKS